MIENNPIEHKQNNLHCLSCLKNGGKIMRYKLTYQRKGSKHTWEHLFPCLDSLEDFLKSQLPFLANYQREWLL